MGRYYWSSKTEADGLKKITIWKLKKLGFLKGYWAAGSLKWTYSGSGAESSVGINVMVSESESYLRIYYTQTDEDGNKKDFDYKIPITTTPCYFGGKRYWFICPWYANKVYCGRRVGVLYLGDKYFACRHCYHLTYNSRNLGGISKVAGQAISAPELDRLKKEVKCKYYAGKITKKYRMYLKKERKGLFQLQIMSRIFGKI